LTVADDSLGSLMGFHRKNPPIIVLRCVYAGQIVENNKNSL
jgi:hypothetical protein